MQEKITCTNYENARIDKRSRINQDLDRSFPTSPYPVFNLSVSFPIPPYCPSSYTPGPDVRKPGFRLDAVPVHHRLLSLNGCYPHLTAYLQNLRTIGVNVNPRFIRSLPSGACIQYHLSLGKVFFLKKKVQENRKSPQSACLPSCIPCRSHVSYTVF
jgi:hypothetical protein